MSITKEIYKASMDNAIREAREKASMAGHRFAHVAKQATIEEHGSPTKGYSMNISYKYFTGDEDITHQLFLRFEAEEQNPPKT